MNISKTIQAIAIVESHDNPYPPATGDSGQAIGRFQFHPGAFWDWSEKPTLSMTWDDWFLSAITKFLNTLSRAYPDMGEREAAVIFHQHCYVRRASAEDFAADDYVERFDAAYRGIK